MLKKIIFWGWVCSQIMPSSTALATPVAAGELVTVVGKAQFVKRQGIVPMCVECEKPKPYWSVVLGGFETSYEFAQPFAVGREKAPEAIEINNVMIRPGAQLQVKGKVARVTRDQSVITDVVEINHMMDLAGASSLAVVDPYIGWTCLSVEGQPQTGGKRIYAEVSYGERNGRRNYRLNVLASQVDDPRSFNEVANIDPVDASNRGIAIVYEGQNHSASGELVISPQNARDERQPSVLTLSRMLKSGGTRMPVQTIVEMRCAPARFLGLE